MKPHRVLAVGLALMIVVAGVGAVLLSPLHAKNPKLQTELVAMADAAMGSRMVVRTSVGFGGERITNSAPPDFAQIEAVRAENGARLKEIVDQYGWPGKKLVGKDGAHAAWLIMMETPDEAFQQRAFELMLTMRDQVGKVDLAFLTDIVAVQRGEPQTYGTQWTCRDGHLRLATPLRDIARVGELREAAGLAPIQDRYEQILEGFGSDRPGCSTRPLPEDTTATTEPRPAP